VEIMLWQANHFICDGRIQAASGNFAAAGWSALHAAWVCDDVADTEFGAAEGPRAEGFRRRAIALFGAAKAAGQTITEEAAGDMVLMADLHRRLGDFHEVAELCQAGAERHPDSPSASIRAAQAAQGRLGAFLQCAHVGAKIRLSDT
jgi:hypothetical protein